MSPKDAKLRPGDLVEVKTPAEIVQTLDAEGTVDHLPFMREMVEYCGQRFRVSRRVVKACASGMKGGSVLRGFRSDDVVLLDGLRCSGADHDGCQKSCTIFWREAWLRKVDESASPAAVSPADREKLRERLRTTAAPNLYFCQASELLRATKSLTKWERYTKWVSEIRSGNCSVWEMAQRMGFFWSGRFIARPSVLTAIAGTRARRRKRSTCRLEKSCRSSRSKASSTHWMRQQVIGDCGFLRTCACCAASNSAWREGSTSSSLTGQERCASFATRCSWKARTVDAPDIAFGGCSRAEYVYWREIWLRRSDESADDTEVSRYRNDVARSDFGGYRCYTVPLSSSSRWTATSAAFMSRCATTKE